MDRRVAISIGGVALILAGVGTWYAFSSSGGNNSEVTTPGGTTSPTTTVSSTTTTTRAATTSTSRGRIATVPTRPPPTVVILTPTTRPTPTTTAPPPPSTSTTTTVTTPPPPTTTTTLPAPSPATKLRQDLLRRLHPSNRGATDTTRVAVTYSPGNTIVVTWAIDTGIGTPPTGPPTCDVPSSTPSTTTSTPGSSTTTAGPFDPATLSTRARARYEAKLILTEIRARQRELGLHFKTVRLIGTYPMQDDQEARVVEVVYSHAANLNFRFPAAFHVPPAQELVCINPAF